MASLGVRSGVGTEVNKYPPSASPSPPRMSEGSSAGDKSSEPELASSSQIGEELHSDQLPPDHPEQSSHEDEEDASEASYSNREEEDSLDEEDESDGSEDHGVPSPGTGSMNSSQQLLNDSYSSIPGLNTSGKSGSFLEGAGFQTTGSENGSSIPGIHSGMDGSHANGIQRTRRRKACIADDEKVCVVCGQFASGYNFDRLTCESCKAFFRRNAMKPAGKIKPCTRENRCEIVGIQRKHCPSCRLAKCFRKGMKKELILPQAKLDARAKPRKDKKRVSASCKPRSGLSKPLSRHEGPFASPPLKIPALGTGPTPQQPNSYNSDGNAPCQSQTAHNSLLFAASAAANFPSNLTDIKPSCSIVSSQHQSLGNEGVTALDVANHNSLTQGSLVFLNGLRPTPHPQGLTHPSLPHQFQLLPHQAQHSAALLLQPSKRPSVHMLPVGVVASQPPYRPHHANNDWSSGVVMASIPPYGSNLPLMPQLSNVRTSLTGTHHLQHSSHVPSASITLAPSVSSAIYLQSSPYDSHGASLPHQGKQSANNLAMPTFTAEDHHNHTNMQQQSTQSATISLPSSTMVPSRAISSCTRELTRLVQTKLVEFQGLGSQMMGTPNESNLSHLSNGWKHFNDDDVSPSAVIHQGPLYSLWLVSVSSLRQHFQQGVGSALTVDGSNQGITSGNGGTVSREQLCNRLNTIVGCITNLAKVVPGFKDLTLDIQADLVKKNIYGLLVIVCSFQPNKEPLLHHLSHMEANTSSRNEDIQEILTTQREKLLSITKQLEECCQSDDYLRVAVFALRLFTVDSLPGSMHMSVTPLYLSVLRFIRRHLQNICNNSPIKTSCTKPPSGMTTTPSGSSTPAYTRILMTLSHCRHHEVRLRAFTEFLDSADLMPLMRDIFHN